MKRTAKLIIIFPWTQLYFVREKSFAIFFSLHSICHNFSTIVVCSAHRFKNDSWYFYQSCNLFQFVWMLFFIHFPRSIYVYPFSLSSSFYRYVVRLWFFVSPFIFYTNNRLNIKLNSITISVQASILYVHCYLLLILSKLKRPFQVFYKQHSQQSFFLYPFVHLLYLDAAKFIYFILHIFCIVRKLCVRYAIWSNIIILLHTTYLAIEKKKRFILMLRYHW